MHHRSKAAAAKGAKKAQQTVLEKYAKNSNSFIDADEVEAIQKAFDKDSDGKLDDIAVSAINPTAKKKKK